MIKTKRSTEKTGIDFENILINFVLLDFKILLQNKSKKLI